MKACSTLKDVLAEVSMYISFSLLAKSRASISLTFLLEGQTAIILVLEVGLVADKDVTHLGMSIDPGFFEPVLNALKRAPASDIIHHEHSRRRSVVGSCKRFELFLASLGSRRILQCPRSAAAHVHH